MTVPGNNTSNIFMKLLRGNDGIPGRDGRDGLPGLSGRDGSPGIRMGSKDLLAPLELLDPLVPRVEGPSTPGGGRAPVLRYQTFRDIATWLKLIAVTCNKTVASLQESVKVSVQH